MIKLKTDPTHTSSNFETGVRSNLNNQISQWLLGIAIVGSFVLAVTNSFLTVVAWHTFWWVVVSFFTMSAMYFIRKETDVRLDGLTELASGGRALHHENTFMVFSLWPVILYWIVFGKDWREARNRFVFWRGKNYLFTELGAEPIQLDSNNVLLNCWIWWFRSADKYDQHAVIIQKEIDDSNLEQLNTPPALPLPEKDLLDEFKLKVDESLMLEKDMINEGSLQEPELFINYFQENYWNEKLTPLMKSYVERRHALVFHERK